MTLDDYTDGRVVALHPDTTAHDAIRAMQDNDGTPLRYECRPEIHGRRTLDHLLDETMHLALLDRADAEAALELVLSHALRYIPAHVARQVLRQLPPLLRQRADPRCFGPDGKVTRARLVRALARCLELGVLRSSEVLEQVGGVLARAVDPDTLDDFTRQLPLDLASTFSVSPG